MSNAAYVNNSSGTN